MNKSILHQPADAGKRHYKMRLATNGSLAEIGSFSVDWDFDKPTQSKRDQQGGGRRGKVKATISRQSRRRLLSKCASFDRSTIDDKQVLFATLTYGSDKKALAWSWSDYKRHLNHFLTVLRQKFDKKVFGLWRIEWQKRGVGHFHLVLMFVDGFKAYIDKDWLASTWNRITEGDYKHLQAGTSIERAKNWKSTQSYFSKTMAYIGKDETVPANLLDKKLGRHWGYINKKVLDNHIKLKTSKITQETFVKLRDYFLDHIKQIAKESGRYNEKAWSSFSDGVCRFNQKMSIFMDTNKIKNMLAIVS